MAQPVRKYKHKERLHEGEREAQEKLGVLEAQKAMSRVIRPFMPAQHRQFFEECISFLFVGSLDSRGDLWASVLPGMPGFIKSPTDTTLEVHTPVPQSDPLSEAMKIGSPLGLIGLQLHSRRRNRANGKVSKVYNGGRDGFEFKLDVSFGNCPKYIQTREVEYTPDAPERMRRTFEVSESVGAFTPEVRAYIDRCDTFFVASCFMEDVSEPSHGVDISHRGVEPGAITFKDDRTLVWPDYLGNFLFNTIGNIIKDPRCGLLFLDFGPEGDILQLTGKAQVEWDLREVPGAHRSVAFTVEKARLVRGALSMFRAHFLERSPYLPAATMRDGIDFSTGLSGYPVTVAEIIEETHDTKTLVLSGSVAIGSTQKPGQHASLLLDIDGETVSRSWTVSSAPRSPVEYNIAITVKKLPGGKASTWLHDQVTVNSKLRLVNIGGTFHLPEKEPPRPLLFIAGGVGVTPLMSMLRGLVIRHISSPADIDVAFLYSVRTPQDIIFLRELTLLTAALPHFKLHITVTQPAARDADLPQPFPTLRRGRWTADSIRESVPDFAKRDAYLCGPDSFMQHIASVLKDDLKSSAPIHTESFSY